MEYLVQHAQEIMFLCFGGGFLILVAYVCTLLSRANRLLTKFDDLVELFITYVQKPVAMIVKCEKILKKVVDFLSK